jgi:hypothetical protein
MPLSVAQCSFQEDLPRGSFRFMCNQEWANWAAVVIPGSDAVTGEDKTGKHASTEALLKAVFLLTTKSLFKFLTSARTVQATYRAYVFTPAASRERAEWEAREFVFQAAQSNPPEEVFVPPAQAGEPPAPTVQPGRHSVPSGRGRIGGETAEAASSHAMARRGALSGTAVGAEIEREFDADAGSRRSKRQGGERGRFGVDGDANMYGRQQYGSPVGWTGTKRN